MPDPWSKGSVYEKDENLFLGSVSNQGGQATDAGARSVPGCNQGASPRGLPGPTTWKPILLITSSNRYQRKIYFTGAGSNLERTEMPKTIFGKLRYFDLLAVVICIGVIAAISSQIFYREYSGSPQAKCMANMRQLGLAIQMAAQDGKEIFPAANEWMSKSGVQGDGIFDCPSSKFKGSKRSPEYLYMAAFFHNQHGLLSRRAMNDVKNMSEAPLLFELANKDTVALTPYVSDAIKIRANTYGYDPQTALLNKIARTRHGGGSIVTFVDGHIAFMMANEITISLLEKSRTAHEMVIMR